MCIICFLSDLNQYNLRKSAQYRSDRFEHSLKLYKESFIVNFKKSLKDKLCESHDTSNNMNIKNFLEKIHIDDIKQVFDILLESYFFWIDGKTSESIKKLSDLLKDYKIQSNITDIYNHIFFRGRISKNFISHWDMFHIPFNKRFIISNQRYSLIGQPLLYLAKSPICVMNELEQTEYLRISTFRFKNTNKIKIFDNTNKFSNIIEIKKNNNNVHKDVNNIIDYNLNKFDIKTIKMYLFHLIISGCCSFEKRGELKEYGFCEEYVLPQILAQTLKTNKFDGILYSSTKAPKKFSYINNNIVYNLFSHNLALFTKYDKKKIDDETYVYDKKLYFKFKISNPILFEDSLNSTQYSSEQMLDDYFSIGLIRDLYDNLKVINDLASSIWNDLNKHDRDIIAKISDVIVAYRFLEEKINSNDNYVKEVCNKNKKAINLHLFMLQNIMLNIRNPHICNND